MIKAVSTVVVQVNKKYLSTRKMLLTVEETSVFRFGLTWLFIMVLIAHWHIMRTRRKTGLVCAVVTVIVASSLLGTYIKNEMNYETMITRISNTSDALVYYDCLIQSEMDRLVGRVWRTKNLLMKLEQTYLSGQCHLEAHFVKIES